MADQAEPAVPAAPAAPTFDPTPDPTPADAATAPATPAAPAPGSSPWSNAPWAQTLEARFADQAQREAVHGYLQEEIQPYVTRREQELGGLSEMWEALDDEQQSLPTYLAIAEEKYGPEIAGAISQAIVAHIEAQGGSDPAQPQGEAQQTYEEWYEEQPPWIQAREDERNAQEEDAQYDSEVQQAASDIVPLGPRALQHFGRYVLALEGDVSEAKKLWDSEMGPVIAAARQDPNLAASLGFDFNDAVTEQVADPPGAPHVLGATGAGGATAPPVEQQYGDMDEVMEDFFNTIKGRQPGSLA